MLPQTVAEQRDFAREESARRECRKSMRSIRGVGSVAVCECPGLRYVFCQTGPERSNPLASAGELFGGRGKRRAYGVGAMLTIADKRPVDESDLSESGRHQRHP